MTDFTGHRLGQYELIAEIGRGGMANVYRAVQASMKREVAVKVLPAHFLQDRTFLDRFTREVEVIARLQHPRILPVYDYGEQDGLPYIVMAYMRGGSLADHLTARGPLPLQETVLLVEQIAQGLDYAHKRGIIHRDFKPSNVLLDEEGNVYLADFGIAKVTEATAQLTGSGIIGTPAYMAPELAHKGGTTPLVDIYALGVTLYQMLSGDRPYDADTPLGMLLAHASHPIPDVRAVRPDLPKPVQTVIEGAMAKDPLERTLSAGEVAKALRAAQFETEPVLPAAPKPDVRTVIEEAAATIQEAYSGADGAETLPAAPVYHPPAPIPAPLAAPIPAPTPPRPAPRRGRPIWLIGCAGLVLAGVVVAVVGLLALRGFGTPSINPEPEDAELTEPPAAAEILTDEAAPEPTEPPDSNAIDCMGVEPGAPLHVIHPYLAENEEHFMSIIAPLLETCQIQFRSEPTSDQVVPLTRLAAGDPPDVLIWGGWEQRAVVEAGRAAMIPLSGLGVHRENYAPYWFDQGYINGQWVALPVRADVRSMIWYSPREFEAAGYAIPQSWDELHALVGDMADDGLVPWSMGMESGEATGWVASDFIQDILLVTRGPEYVMGIIHGDIPYNDEGVREAYELYGEWASNPFFTPDGVDGTLGMHFYDALLSPFAGSPPEAMMVHQGGWAGQVIQEEIPDFQFGTDYDFFAIPAARGVLGSADWLYAFSDAPAVRAFVAYLSSARGGRAWAEAGLALTPNLAGEGAYPDPLMQKQADLLYSAGMFTPDLGDVIGGDFTFAEWEAIVQFLNGEDLDVVLEQAAQMQAQTLNR